MGKSAFPFGGHRIGVYVDMATKEVMTKSVIDKKNKNNSTGQK